MPETKQVSSSKPIRLVAEADAPPGLRNTTARPSSNNPGVPCW